MNGNLCECVRSNTIAPEKKVHTSDARSQIEWTIDFHVLIVDSVRSTTAQQQ